MCRGLQWGVMFSPGTSCCLSHANIGSPAGLASHDGRRPATVVVGQHAVCAAKSMSVPTWTWLQPGKPFPWKNVSPQGGQVRYTNASAEVSNDRWRSVISCEVFTITSWSVQDWPSWLTHGINATVLTSDERIWRWLPKKSTVECRPKKATFSAPLAAAMGRSPRSMRDAASATSHRQRDKPMYMYNILAKSVQ